MIFQSAPRVDDKAVWYFILYAVPIAIAIYVPFLAAFWSFGLRYKMYFQSCFQIIVLLSVTIQELLPLRDKWASGLSSSTKDTFSSRHHAISSRFLSP
jgi:hypothetical protein